MKPSNVYRKAAANLEKGVGISVGWSCWAIEEVLEEPFHGPKTKECEKHPLVREYEDMFRPPNSEHTWGFEWNNEERMGCRILALCFMAAIVENP